MTDFYAQNAKMRYDHETLNAMTPVVEGALHTVLESNAMQPEQLIKDPDIAFQRLAWCQEILERVRNRVGQDSHFDQVYGITLDQGIAMIVLLETRAEPTQALLAFGLAARRLLFEVGQAVLPPELFECFDDLVWNDITPLVEFCNSLEYGLCSTLLARVFVFHTAIVACFEEDSACSVYENSLEGTARALLLPRAVA